MKSVLSALLILIASTTSLATSITITNLSSVEAFQCGDVVSYNNAKQLEIDRSWLSLTGDFTSAALDKPSTTFFIRIIPAKNQFFVEIGCLVLKRELSFDPTIFGGESILQTGSSRPYYVSQTFFGGRKSQAFSYLQMNKKWLPEKGYFEFNESPEGQRNFKKTLAELLRDFSNSFHLESDSQNALEKPSLGEEMRVYLTPRGEPEDGPHLKALALFKQATSAAPEKVDMNEVKAEGYLNALNDYRANLIRSDRQEAVMLVLRPYPSF